MSWRDIAERKTNKGTEMINGNTAKSSKRLVSDRKQVQQLREKGNLSDESASCRDE
jgi:hypothetical protein